MRKQGKREYGVKLAEIITKTVDLLYLKPVRRVIPRETFRYAMCGGLNLLLGWILYTLVFRYVIAGCYIDLGLVVMSPHIATLFIQFPITFLTGFWLNRYVTFSLSTLSGGTQLFRYLLQNAGALLLSYLLMKLFVEALHIYAPVAKPFTDAVVVVYSYLTARFFTFGTSGKSVEADCVKSAKRQK